MRQARPAYGGVDGGFGASAAAAPSAARPASASRSSSGRSLPQPQQGNDARVLVSNARGQQRIIGDPFAPSSSSAFRGGVNDEEEERRLCTQLNSFGVSVNARGQTSGALLSRQQQESLKAAEGADMLLSALETYGPAPGARAMLGWERDAARHAVEKGVYVSWRSRHKGQDCTRVGPESLCFCGHVYASHGGPANDGWKKNRMRCDEMACACANFSFIPRRPEECGEWWLPRRKGFDVTTWKAKCKCGHAHDEHNPAGSAHPCAQRGCPCGSFNSSWLCVVCERHGEEHDTIWETASERISSNRPVGEDYLPFAEAPHIARLVYDRDPAAAKPRPGEGPVKLKPKKALTPARAGVPATSVVGVGSASASASSPSAAAAAGRPAPSAAAAPSAAPRSSTAAARHVRAVQEAQHAAVGDIFAAAQSRASATSAATATPPPAGRTSSAARSAGRPAASTAGAPLVAPSRSSGVRVGAVSSASSAAAARARRVELEEELAAQARSTSSGFKPVFD